MPLSNRYLKWYGNYHPLEPTDQKKNRADDGIMAFCQYYELTCTEASIVVSSTPKTSKQTTPDDYGRIWQDFYKFAVLHGDFCSASLLERDLCLDSPFPVLPKYNL
jgi:hypothetical protein